MGKYDDAMYRYLSDNDRFADLFNAVLFGGERVLQGEMLESASERYVEVNPETAELSRMGERQRHKSNKVCQESGRAVTSSGFRDIKKHLQTGEGFASQPVGGASRQGNPPAPSVHHMLLPRDGGMG